MGGRIVNTYVQRCKLILIDNVCDAWAVRSRALSSTDKHNESERGDDESGKSKHFTVHASVRLFLWFAIALLYSTLCQANIVFA